MFSFPPPTWLTRPETLTGRVIRSGLCLGIVAHYFLTVLGLDDDPIMSAILRMSKSELNELRTPLGDTIYGSSNHRLWNLTRYLSACAGWPDGMRIILTCMHTPRQAYHDEWPLSYAYYLKHWESVDLLLKLGLRPSYKMLEWFGTGNEETLKRLVQDIWRHSGPLQLQADEPCPILDDPAKPYWIYHLDLPVKATNTLYEAGFRDLDTEGYVRYWSEDSQDHTTPLWKLARSILNLVYYNSVEVWCHIDGHVDRARWFVDKGAHKDWLHPRFQTTAVHLLPVALLRKFSSESVSVIITWHFGNRHVLIYVAVSRGSFELGCLVEVLL
jgi:hypothetical protein